MADSKRLPRILRTSGSAGDNLVECVGQQVCVAKPLNAKNIGDNSVPNRGQAAPPGIDTSS
ncbi:hypothetical protein [Nocardia thraciensis]